MRGEIMILSISPETKTKDYRPLTMPLIKQFLPSLVAPDIVGLDSTDFQTRWNQMIAEFEEAFGVTVKIEGDENSPIAKLIQN